MSDESSGPDFFGDVASFYTFHALVLGLRTGLIDVVLAGPGTVDEIAERAGVDPVHTGNWLNALTAARYLSHQGGVYRVVDDAVAVLSGTTQFLNARAVIEAGGEFGALSPVVIDAVRSGGHVPDGAYGGAFGAAVAGINSPMYRNFLVEWLRSDERLALTLESGATVVDLGCGDGSAVAAMAAEFPRSTFVGVDVNPNVVAMARSVCAEENARVDMTAPPRAQIVTVLDSFHHFADADSTLGHLREMLGDDGTLVIAEAIYSGEVAEDTASPYNAVGWAVALLYCDQEGRQPGRGKPIGNQDGGQRLQAALATAGFTDVSTFDTPNDYRFYFAR